MNMMDRYDVVVVGGGVVGCLVAWLALTVSGQFFSVTA